MGEFGSKTFGPNMRIKEHAGKGGKSVSKLGIKKRTLSMFKKENVPEELQDLFDWYKSLDMKQVDYLLELKNIYGVLKGGIMKKLLENAESGKTMNHSDLAQLRLAVEIMEKSHKLKYGDKKVIENVVTIQDIRRQMSSERKIIKPADFDDN